MADYGECFILDDDDLVCHTVGSAGSRGSRSWKSEWERSTGRVWPSSCQILGCGNPATLGAHVHVKRMHKTFILPACHGCNGDRMRDFDHGYTKWVSAKRNAIVVQTETHERVARDNY